MRYNQTTQPTPVMPVFNNWAVVAEGWYIAGPSRSLPVRQARSREVCGQWIVLFRGQDGRVRALDAFCPHMGTDLGIGQVMGDHIRCAFHHWEFDGAGVCKKIPCQHNIPDKARVQAYATEEKYGFIWVYPAATAPHPVPEFEELRGKSTLSLAESKHRLPCHYHICMINGVDVHHFQTTHQFETALTATWQPDSAGTSVRCDFTGQFPNTHWRDRLARWLIGPDCHFLVQFVDGCTGLLTTNKTARSLPPLHMLLAFAPTADGQTQMQPIYITERRSGFGGWLLSWFVLLLTRLQFYVLQGDEARILSHIQFNPQALIDLDRQSEQFIDYINQLKPSIWSKQGDTPRENHSP